LAPAETDEDISDIEANQVVGDPMDGDGAIVSAAGGVPLADADDFSARLIDETSLPRVAQAETADDGFEDDFNLPPSGRFDDEEDNERSLIAALSARLSSSEDTEEPTPSDDNSTRSRLGSLPTSFGEGFASDLGTLDSPIPEAPFAEVETDAAATSVSLDADKTVSPGPLATDEALEVEAQSEDHAQFGSFDDEDPQDSAVEDRDLGAPASDEAVSVEDPDFDEVGSSDASVAESSDSASEIVGDATSVPDAKEIDTAPETSETRQAEQPADDAASLMARAKMARARVVKIRRSDAPPRPAPLTESTEAPTDETSTPLEGTAPSVQPRRPVVPRRPRIEAAEDDASVKRLIEQTNSELDGPENRRRLSAIAHLKAAVAATVADRKAGVENKGPSDETRISPYRSDLERVMRPRVSQPDDKPSPVAPPAERPAPLVLVSEQRIDRPRPAQPAEHGAPATAGHPPVWPRRVAGGGALAMQAAQDQFDPEDDSEEDDTGVVDSGTIFDPQFSFADFVDRIGADSLPDLLEAATAYALCVEGREYVSRPQMVKHVITLRPDLEEKREDVMRVFGTLLREGRIEKVRRGQFALQEGSPLLAEGKKAVEGDQQS